MKAAAHKHFTGSGYVGGFTKKGAKAAFIAEVPADPPTTYERVVEKLGERIPDDVSVLIDMESLWAGALGLDSTLPNLLLVDREGNLSATYQGRYEPGLGATVVKHVEVLQATP